jgi:hypothetical protein
MNMVFAFVIGAFNLPYNLKLHNLQVEKSVPVHGTVQKYAEVLKTIESRRTAAAAS